MGRAVRIPQRGRLAAAYLILFLAWAGLWRLPVLMADDRFFAVASGLSRGRQTLDGVVELISRCWNEYNGRLVDGLGAVFFALGDTGIRLLMALFYVALTAVLWAYLRLAGRIRGDSQPAHPQRAWLAWLLLAAWPFVLIALSGRVAGESVLLMAATWNYVLPLALTLGSLYPFMRRVAGIPMPGWVEWLALPLIFGSLLMHEIVTLVGLAVAGLGTLALLRRRQIVVAVLTLGVVVAGVITKFMAPGLWGRVSKYQGIDAALLQTLRAKAVTIAMSLNCLVSYDFFVWAVVLLALAVVCWVGWRRGEITGNRLRWGSGLLILAAGSLLSWLAVAVCWLPSFDVTQRDLAAVIRTMLLESVISVLPAGLFMLALVGLVVVIPARVLSPIASWGIIVAILTAALVAYTSIPQYLGFHRSLYLTSIIAVISAIFALIGAMMQPLPETETRADLLRRGLPAALLAVALAAAITVTAQLSVNRTTWHRVEEQVAAMNAGSTQPIQIPTSLPCSQVMWYFTGVNLDSFIQQWRIYYGIPEDIPVKLVEVKPGACPLS